ncbi:MAG: hypothetical protein U5K69_25670 [Balneolaceae bacterium]|nr:hypothetical protein [Balneolaceae bacterium]
MIRKTIYSLLVVFLFVPLAQAQDKAFSRMDVFALEWAQDPQISPDGDQIVYMRRGMDTMNDRPQFPALDYE